nr:hypothetical protein [Tanacetum cinerariifolium]
MVTEGEMILVVVSQRRVVVDRDDRTAAVEWGHGGGEWREKPSYPHYIPSSPLPTDTVYTFSRHSPPPSPHSTAAVLSSRSTTTRRCDTTTKIISPSVTITPHHHATTTPPFPAAVIAVAGCRWRIGHHSHGEPPIEPPEILGCPPPNHHRGGGRTAIQPPQPHLVVSGYDGATPSEASGWSPA